MPVQSASSSMMSSDSTTMTHSCESRRACTVSSGNRSCPTFEIAEANRFVRCSTPLRISSASVSTPATVSDNSRTSSVVRVAPSSSCQSAFSKGFSIAPCAASRSKDRSLGEFVGFAFPDAQVQNELTHRRFVMKMFASVGQEDSKTATPMRSVVREETGPERQTDEGLRGNRSKEDCDRERKAHAERASHRRRSRQPGRVCELPGG